MMCNAQNDLQTAFFAFGSNLSTATFPQPLQTIQHSIREMERKELRLVSCGSFYETEPVPKSDQPWYVNTVAKFETSLTGQELLNWALELELIIGRERSVPNAARVIDIDLIDWDGQVSRPDNRAENPLVLPHPRADKRAFVLYPLKDICANWQHPETGVHIDNLISNISGEQVLGVHFKRLNS